MSATAIYRLEQLQLPFEALSEENLWRAAAARLQLPERQLKSLELARRSLDVRHRPTWVCGVNLQLDSRYINSSNEKYLRLLPPPWLPPPHSAKERHYVIIGAGPAGLSAAHILALAGQRVTVVEQGKKVEERRQDVAALFQNGTLDEHSNLCAGEGGAGTFSDGKIYTRRADSRVDWFLKQLGIFLDDKYLAIDYHAHVGTDRLLVLLQKWRRFLEDNGVTFCFNCEVKEILFSGHSVTGVKTVNDGTIRADGVIMAAGNSARRLWRHLYERQLQLETMPAAIGVRVEHPQSAINEWRYGKWARLPDLPAAEYFYTAPFNGRPCHTFCMCPGGTVIPTPTEAGALAVNGMSNRKRSGQFANAAWICEYGAADVGSSAPLAIMEFQEELEQKFYQAGGGAYAAPAQLITDFLAKKSSGNLLKSSYRRPLMAVNMWELLPVWTAEALHYALGKLVREKPLLSRGLLIGLESRPSNPLRISRDANYQALGFTGLYPCGEGSGYASGITSSALDGIMVAESLIRGNG